MHNNNAASSSISSATGSMKVKAVLGAVCGNLIEFLDFAIYGLLSAVISRIFFPEGDPAAALLAAFMIYASSFLVRPLGGLVLGRVGDKWGRRTVLTITIGGMCAATALTALLPTYADIGSWATVLLIVCRLAQGFFAGGEYATATSYIVEHGGSRFRAFRASFSPAGAYVGTAIALGLFTLLSSLISTEAMEQWGWRVMFAVGVPLGLIGIWIRHYLDESPEFLVVEQERRRQRRKAPPLREVLRTQWRQMLLFFSILMSHTLSNYLVKGFFYTYLTVFVGIASTQAALAVFISQTMLIFSTVAHGYLNDCLGRRRTLLLGSLLIIPAVFAAFWIGSAGTPTAAIIAALVPVLIFPMVTSGMTIGLVDMFPAEMRLTAGSLAYNVGTALFGGTAPLVGVWLVERTGSPFAVALYVSVVALITFTCVALFYRHRLIESSPDAMPATS